MNRRIGAALLGTLVAIALPAATSEAASAAVVSRIATTTSLTEMQTLGRTPGKVTFEIIVHPTSGVRPHGQVHLSVDGVLQVSLVLKNINRSSYTGHYRPGSHIATVTYSGTSTDQPSAATITFNVT